MNILVAYDGSSFADKALDRAVHIARKEGAGSLILLSVTPDLCLPATGELSKDDCDKVTRAVAKESESSLQKAAQRLNAEDLGEIRTLVAAGDPADRIVENAVALGVGLIVLGSYGRQGGKRLYLGSVAGRVAQQAPCDVLIVK